MQSRTAILETFCVNIKFWQEKYSTFVCFFRVKPENFHIDGQTALPNVSGVKVYQRMDQRTSQGAIGDSRAATAEKGEKYFKAVTVALADLFVNLAEAEKGDLPYL